MLQNITHLHRATNSVLGLFGVLTAAVLSTSPASAQIAYHFSTGSPDGLLATASQPSGGSAVEIETADDFVLSESTFITDATFTGLITSASGLDLSKIGQVRAEIYRLFPNDSDSARTPDVPTRVNSPSDVALAERDSLDATLTFTSTVLNPTFSVSNSVLNGIHPAPNQMTGGEGPVQGTEVLFDLKFSTPFKLAPDHYFFVPQVSYDGGQFYWLSTAKPIGADGTAFAPDLQSWIRDETLSPDWLRVGTDIVGAGPFNASFSLDGTPVSAAVPEPSTYAFFATALLGLAVALKRRRQS